MLHTKAKIRIPGAFRSWVEEALGKFTVTEAPLNREVALVSHELKLPHNDPADHFLAASALIFELTLLTVDERLSRLKWLPTLSR